MSYPFLSDIVNALFGTQWQLPFATFGCFVAIAILVAARIARNDIKRQESWGRLDVARLANGNPVPVHTLVGELTVIAAIGGILGARLLHILEYPSEFIADPINMLFSGAGLSIYGGLVVGGLAGALFLHRRSVPLIPVLDALAPALAMGYAIGRLGCQISGDGDWGTIANMALKPDWLPQWLWAQTYTNNIVGTVIPASGVYPTPIYEAGMAMSIFGVLWFLRRPAFKPGFVFSSYLILSGFARLLIEKIRINSEYQLFTLHFTQAELISFTLILIGTWGMIKTYRTHVAIRLGFSFAVIGLLSACSQLG